MNDPGKSDKPVVAMRGPGPCGIPVNQPEAGNPPQPANFWDLWKQVKRRSLTKKNEEDDSEPEGQGPPQNGPAKQSDGTQSPVRPAQAGSEGLQSALERIRQAARRDRELKFTNLWHHVYGIEQLREAYLGLKRQAAPGVDGQTWQQYGKNLEENLRDLSERLIQGTYHARPVQRVYIPEADGRKRPIGMPVLEDKIVQRATVRVLNAVYEEDFLGFSYGFRPGRNCHQALDALAVGISPLLANIYLHYVFDLWAEQWRHRMARGDVIIVRYADDFVVGFQHKTDADEFLTQLRERFRQFGLELHAEKTRVIEFGRFAAERRKQRKQGKPATFNFLGFTHSCSKTRNGKFVVLRQTIAKRLRTKLEQIREKLRKRMHDGVEETGRWLRSVVQGYMQFHGIPRNLRAVSRFRHWVSLMWREMMSRRSQKGAVRWDLMAKLIHQWLPVPHICHPYPEERLAGTLRGKSPVR